MFQIACARRAKRAGCRQGEDSIDRRRRDIWGGHGEKGREIRDKKEDENSNKQTVRSTVYEKEDKDERAIVGNTVKKANTGEMYALHVQRPAGFIMA